MPAWFRTFQKNLTKYNQNHIYSTRICCLLSKVWNLQTFYCFISFPVGPRSEVLRGARYRPRPQYYRPRPAPPWSCNPITQTNSFAQQLGADTGWKMFCFVFGNTNREDQKQPQLASHLIMGGNPIDGHGTWCCNLAMLNVILLYSFPPVYWVSSPARTCTWCTWSPRQCQH